MFNRFGLFSIVFLACLVVAGAAKAQEAADLTRIFDAYNVAAKAGDVKKMLSMRTAEQHKEISKEIVKKKEREYFLLIGRAQVPESYEVQHVSRVDNGQGANLYLLVQFPAMREIDRPRTRMEEMVSFKKEKDEWKIDSAMPLGDPDKVKRPKDLTYDPKEANTDVSGKIGGRIVKTEFFPTYTLVILRVMDEEDAVFLPAKEELQRAGMPLEDLDPWKIHEFSGYPHRSDKQKFFATGGKLIEQ